MVEHSIVQQSLKFYTNCVQHDIEIFRLRGQFVWMDIELKGLNKIEQIIWVNGRKILEVLISLK